MYKLLLVAAFVALAAADVAHLGQEIKILRQEQDIQPDGSYQWSYETENGINAQEQGHHQATGPEEGVQSAQGSFQFQSPEGEQVQVQYVADDNGFQPQGSHIPTPPPIPPEIQRALDWIAAHPEPESKQRF